MKNISIKLIFLLVSIFVFFDEGTAQASAIEQFRIFIANTASAKGSFIQVQMKVVNGVAKPNKISSGEFKFDRPGKFIWAYTKPYEQILQSDGNKLYLYDKDLNQVTIKPVENSIAFSPAAVLFGGVNMDKNFTLRDTGITDGVEWLEAIPNAKDSQFHRMTIGMKNGLPMGLELFDTFGNFSVITLNNIEKKPSFSADQFKFIVLPSMEVLRQ